MIKINNLYILFFINMNSQSLKNGTLAPGWRNDEVEVLKVALMKYGIGI